MSSLRSITLVFALYGAAGPQVAAAFEVEDECADEGSLCFDCTSCSCCPFRVANLAAQAPAPLMKALTSIVVERLDEPVLSAASSDIFHPPRA